jgi:hypothetical protein
MNQTGANRMGRITAMIEILSLKVPSCKPLRATRLGICHLTEGILS